MTIAPTPDERLDRLEERTAFQERTIEDLNTAISDQWKQIERLKREIAALTDQLREVEGGMRPANAPDPLPPHY